MESKDVSGGSGFQRRPRRERERDGNNDAKVNLPEDGDFKAPAAGNNNGNSNSNSNSNSNVISDTSETAAPKSRRRAIPEDKPVTEGASNWMKVTNAVQQQDNQPDEPEIKPKFFDDAETTGDILVIPELDEDANEESIRVAHAPRNTNRKLPTLDELENGEYLSISRVSADIEAQLDLTMLLNNLTPIHLLLEEDVNATWTFDSLLREITDELVFNDKLISLQSQSGNGGKSSKDSMTAAMSMKDLKVQ